VPLRNGLVESEKMKHPKIETKTALATASAVQGDILQKSKALSAQLGGPTTTAKPAQPASATTAVASEVKLRPDVIEFGKRAQLKPKPVTEQSQYEQRYYNRNYHTEQVDLNTVTHVTSHTASMIRERLLSQLQSMYALRSEPKSLEFKCRDIIDAWDIFGPGQSDCVRTIFRELAKANKVKEIPHEHGRRTTFTYELLELVQPAPAKAQ